MAEIQALKFVAQNGDVTSAGQSVLPRSAISHVSTPAAIDANAPSFLSVKIPKEDMDLTFRGPCIVTYPYNKTNQMH